MRLSSLKPRIKLTIENPRSKADAALGPGVVALLEGVRDTGSLNASAKNMNMAYSKAWRIIRETEDALGVTFLDRDGARGSTLTKEGIALLDAYRKIQAEIQEKTEAAYKKIF